ncbi:LapD/MoxY N-terminal periplasmic domain-containing protein [Legionella sp. CNM-4043-24]|uniref:LapD/MoxY N-terminal periplasmic domain-containing protein n=1 Tax=Legionella sp. CNM-4043-24 TaxID=3421646 RepID=UPI00403AB469
MTLINKVTACLLLLLLLLFAGTYLVTLNNARNFFIEQLNSNARDTATSLALSLSRPIARQDQATIESMVKVVFGHDDFSMIDVRDAKGNLLVSQNEKSSRQVAPGWFVDLIEWPSSVQSAAIIIDGKQSGDVLVTSDSHFACDALWHNAMQLLQWFVLFAGLFVLLMYSMMQKLLAPLQRVIMQAEGMANNDLFVVSDIPDTHEFKKITLLMNQIVNSRVLGQNRGPE